MKTIFGITGSRADYGLLKNLYCKLSSDKNFNFKLIVSGSHFSRKFGNTLDEIKNDNLDYITSSRLLFLKDDPLNISNIFGKLVIDYSKIFNHKKPDLLILLGDRYEVYAAAIAAMFFNITIAHIHGGEVTNGSMDDSIRHSISKIAHLHFVSCDDYKKRLIQLGEEKKRIFNVGSLGCDYIKSIKLFSKKSLEKELNIIIKKKCILVTFHPNTRGPDNSKDDFKQILMALSKQVDTTLIFTSPNADIGNSAIDLLILEFKKNNKNSFYFKSLGIKKYVSLLSIADLVLGNSSSGIYEAPLFKIPTINIGNRQHGRKLPVSVINCRADIDDICKALKKSFSLNFLNKIKKMKYPFGNGGASIKIFNTLRKIDDYESLKFKKFIDVGFF